MKLPRFFPQDASTIASSVDNLYLFVVAVTTIIFVLVCAVALYFFYKYKRKSEDEMPEPIEGNMLLEITWSVIPLILLMVMFVMGLMVYYKTQRVPENAMPVYVVGKQWMWKVQHVNGPREINDLHVPINTPIKLFLTSEDVIHSYYIPAFRIKRDTVPGRYTTAWFEATKIGTYHIFCAEYCGTKHSQMIGKVHVMSEQDYAKWLGEVGDNAPVQTVSLDGLSDVEAGEILFQKHNCYTCHLGGGPAQLGPTMTGKFGSMEQLQDGTEVLVDEEYVRESIYDPMAKITKGYQPVMPTFKGQVNERDLVRLTAYIKSLAPAANEGAE